MCARACGDMCVCEYVNTALSNCHNYAHASRCLSAGGGVAVVAVLAAAAADGADGAVAVRSAAGRRGSHHVLRCLPLPSSVHMHLPPALPETRQQHGPVRSPHRHQKGLTSRHNAQQNTNTFFLAPPPPPPPPTPLPPHPPFPTKILANC